MTPDAIKSLRKSLKAQTRASLVDILDEALELLEDVEQRLRRMEAANEETD